MNAAIIGSGSWATALAKIWTDKKQLLHWWIRQEDACEYLATRHHNRHYLSSVNFDPTLLTLSTDLRKIIQAADLIVIAVPSAYIKEVLEVLEPADLNGKWILSAIKGIVPDTNVLLNEYLAKHFSVSPDHYFAVLGPCHAEEVAAEKLSYLTFSGSNISRAAEIAGYFKTSYINTVVNEDINGVQYAAVLKNVYAVGAGIAHGLDYGDNFFSVYIANCADEMAGFLRKSGVKHIVVGEHEAEDPVTHRKNPNYAASVYLGDLLVTCYSPYSRNRSFGNMIGKGYPVKTAQLEMNMVAEGLNAARCVFNINQSVKADMPIASALYSILWENVKPRAGFKRVEDVLV